mmetsp:Transcript_28857/g.84597  ORF Transcript_28857/g.84597 Transcript_28857/m.84597 type:complete len:231 (+) Transcript_28857:746-1438(+)
MCGAPRSRAASCGGGGGGRGERGAPAAGTRAGQVLSRKGHAGTQKPHRSVGDDFGVIPCPRPRLGAHAARERESPTLGGDTPVAANERQALRDRRAWRIAMVGCPWDAFDPRATRTHFAAACGRTFIRESRDGFGHGLQRPRTHLCVGGEWGSHSARRRGVLLGVSGAALHANTPAWARIAEAGSCGAARGTAWNARWDVTRWPGISAYVWRQKRRQGPGCTGHADHARM